MLARACTRCVGRPRPARRTKLVFSRVQRRPFGTSPGATAATTHANGLNVGSLAPIVSELDRMAPSLDIRGEDIFIMRSPADFYETLKDRIRTAKRRIFLSTLYIGKSERDLVATLQEALRRNPELKLSILTDCLRGTREAPGPSCASLLVPLVSEFGARVEIRMYHTPNLTGLRKKYVPRRINEGWGLQHMKLYGVDDEIIMSGANLSTDYFTNRQDRYHLFSSKEMTDHFRRIHDGVASFSFLVEPSLDPAGFTLSWPASNSAPNPIEEPRSFIKSSSATLKSLVSPAAQDVSPKRGPTNTRVYMLGQFSQIMQPDHSTELPVLTHILGQLASPQYKNSSWTFTAGYFNPAPSLTKLLINTASTNNTVITAAPEANGFYQSRGISGLLPDAYVLLARRFLDAVTRSRRDNDIALKEWRLGTKGHPGGWTYHAKGLWVTMPRQVDPSISIIGSSNYTKRSYSHDLEVGALIVTQDDKLMRKLGDEQAWLQEHARRVTRDDFATNERRVGLQVRIAMWIVSLVGGAL